MTALSALAGLSLVVWLYLLFGRQGFWRARPRIEDEVPPEPGSWPAVAAIVPARNEAAHVGEALRSLLIQEYPGELAVVLVDDHSADGTGAIARRLYRLCACRLPTLPLAGALYAAMTLDSAIQYRRGIGGRWKARVFSSQ